MKKICRTSVITLLSLLVSFTCWCASGLGGATVSPATQTICSPGTATLTVTGTNGCTAGTAWSASYQWYVSTDGGTSWGPVSGATGTITSASPSAVFTPTLTSSTTLTYYYYRAQVFAITSPCAGVGPTITTSTIQVAVTTVPPGPITGTLSVCDGSTTSLSIVGGGSWTSTNSAVAPIGSATGVAVGVSAGVTMISVTNGCGLNTALLTVNPRPALFSPTGGGDYCAGGTGVPIGLSGSVTGFTYQLLRSSTLIATLAGTGSSLNFGLQTVAGSYSIKVIDDTTSCTTTISTAGVTVDPQPTQYTVMGGGGYCAGGAGALIYLSYCNSGISYQLLNGSSFVGSPMMGMGTSELYFGYFTAPGPYSVIAVNPTTGCSAEMLGTVDVFPVSPPAAITGTLTICEGGTTTLSNSVAGGIWISADPAVATISSAGVVTGNTAGTTHITYSISGCLVTVEVTVTALPATITGAASVCQGMTATKSISITGGTWSSGSPSIATIDSATGVVNGVSNGTAFILYTLASGCTATSSILVLPNPAPILGTPSVCVGSYTTLTDASAGGTWSSGAVGTASITDTGIVTGVAPGTAMISYTSGIGCSSTIVSTVNAMPAAAATVLCVGQAATAASGVTMTSGTPTVAAITGAGTIVTGISAGTSLITYIAGATGCATTSLLSVNLLPAITGATALCQYVSTSLGASPSGGTWISEVPTIASVSSSGNVSGLLPGTSLISYTAPTGCSSATTVTVNAAPAAISGTLTVCTGATTTLSSATSGGAWSTGSSFASVGATSGIVSGISTGTAIITYTASGCSVAAVVTVNATAAITGSPSICSGLTTTFTDATPGGTWTSSNSAIAVIGSTTGIVNAVTGGTVTITYSGGGCGAVTTTLSVVASTAPITGTFAVCLGSTTDLTSATAGGTWTSGSSSVASVGSATGLVMGLASGTSIITYSAGSCGDVTAVVTVNNLPAAITGTYVVCSGLTMSLSNSTSGGTWSIAPTSTASINSSGVVTGISSGTATVSYILSTGCRATAVVTVMPAPSAIAGTATMCVGAGTTLSSFPTGGIWTSAVPGIVMIVSGGIISGSAPGTSTITYSTSSGCIATLTVTVNTQPAAIGGPSSICAGAMGTLTDATTGGSWSASPAGTLTIGSATGIITAGTVGTATVYYSMPSGCAVNKTVTVSAAPAAITGSGTLCDPGMTTLSSASSGGSWVSDNVSVAMINSVSGVVTSITSGTTIITYTLPGGCYATRIETVLPSPAAITGTMVFCDGTTTTLSDATPGGTWTSSGVPLLVGSTTGVLTGISSGTGTITYTQTSTGCYNTTIVTVNPPVGYITSGASICTGSTSSLSSSTIGGTWTSSDPSVASINITTGVVTGVAAGTTIITYTRFSCTVTTVVTVSTSVAALTGTLTICRGTGTILSGAPSGGSWTSGAPSVATVGTSGNVSGVAAGTAAITYTVGTCGSAYATVTVNPTGSVFTVVGGGSSCSGTSAIALTNSEVGVNYQLYSGASPSGSLVAGTGTALFMASVTAGTYTVKAINSFGCTTNMAGTAAVTTLPLPATFIVTGGGSSCIGMAGVPIGLSMSSIGVSYQLYNGSSTVGSPVTGTGATISLGTFSVAGTYSVLATNTTSGCTSNMAGTATVSLIAGCTGTPAGGTAVTSSSISCLGSSIFLTLSGATMMCGISYQWQYSDDGTSWTNMTGAVATTCSLLVYTSRYYRCAVTCGASGITSYSSSVHVTATYLITAHTAVAPDTPCSAAHFYISSCSTSSALSVLTYFGDGTSTTTGLISGSAFADANIYHSYALPGTYTVKHVLYYSGIAYDSVTFSYEYFYCHRLAVKFYRDNNTNCLFDAGDLYNTTVVNTEVDSNGVHIDTIAATTGFYYSALGPAGTVYRFRVLSVTGGVSVACPSTGILYDTITTSSAPVRYFGLQCGASGFDLVESVTQTNTPWVQSSTIYLSNTYCTTVAPVLTMHFSPHYVFSSAYPSPSSIMGNTLVWNLPAVGATSSYTPYVSVTLLSTSFIPLGDTIHSDYLATPLSGDVNTANNFVQYIRTITASYDPNEMAVSPRGYIIPCTELQYTIDFENTGNDTAHNIYVLDTLSDYLDANSIAVSYASNVMNISMIRDGGFNVVKFDFPDIDLPDSSHHNLCRGMFTYTIRAKVGLPVGTSINNRAGIYFDNNPVVLTNTASNTIGIAPVSGPASLCTGFSGTFNDVTAGGTWATNDASIATASASGTVSAHRVGTSIVSYTASNSCGSLSATTSVTIDSSYVPVVSIAVYPGTYITAGQHDTLVASVAGAGPTPAYRWLVNGVPQAGATGTTFASSSLADGDSVVCEVMGSGVCGLPSYNFVLMHVSADASSAVQSQGLTLYPNPNTGTFTVVGEAVGSDMQLEVRNMLGQCVHTETIQVSNGQIHHQLHLDKTLANGMYTLILHSGNQRSVIHFMLQQ